MSIEVGSFSLGLVAGGIVVGIANHYLAKSRTEEDRIIKGFNDAATKFRSSIINELIGLYPLPIDWPQNIAARLKESSPKIQVAVEEFRHFVPPNKAKAFSMAWMQYFTSCKYLISNNNSARNILRDVDNAKQSRQDFKRNVEVLLSFAQII